MTLVAENVEKRYYGLNKGNVVLRQIVDVYHCDVCDHVEEKLFDSEDE